ncbi:MAG: tetratricopeptide repeat protein [Candidatus Poribacteria bacterium]|nr:tetratricopeptide repeat protein [Candidatus Poribacteria bacterium]
MSNLSNTSNDKPRTVLDIISEIEQKSNGGGYIYRGERKCNPKVSSKLYRDFEIEEEHFNIELVQKEMLAAAKRHTGHLPQDFRVDVTALPSFIGESTEEAIDFEILTEIQHYGGKTNLIDFTTDYFIALFFACDGRYNEDGRVILQKIDEIRDMIAHPRNPRHRVIAQKSVFIRPPRGFIEPHKNDIVTIPANLKQQILEHLRDYHGISTEVIYNDLYGFIRNQDFHGDAYTHFYRGFACGNRGDQETAFEAKQVEYENAIKHFTEAIRLKTDLANAYFNRGVTYAFRGEFDDAIRDFNTVIQLQPNHAGAYYNRGNTYVDKGELDNAIKDFSKAIELDTYYLNAHHNRGFAYLKKGEFDDAIKNFDTAIQLQPNHAESYNNRGEAWLHLQEWEKAKSDLITAKDMGADIISTFHNDYANVEDFEQKTDIQLPKDIAALLTPAQA